MYLVFVFVFVPLPWARPRGEHCLYYILGVDMTQNLVILIPVFQDQTKQ